MGRKIHIDKISERAGITVQWLRKLSGAGIVPAIEKSMIDEAETYLALAKYWREQSENVDDELLAARTRKVTAEAERQELSLARERGDLLPKENVLGALRGIVEKTKFAVLQLAAVIPNSILGIPGREQKGVIEQICRSVLLMLYNNIMGDLGEQLKRNSEFQELLKNLRRIENERKEKYEKEISGNRG